MMRPKLGRRSGALLVDAFILCLSFSTNAYLVLAQDSAPAPVLQSPVLSAPTTHTPVAQPPLRWRPAAQTSASPLTVSSAASSSDIAGALKSGQKLEAQRRWAEAYTLYEDTARLNYSQPHLELDQHLDVAKMHFDIGRRYADAAFRRSAATLSDFDALEMYTDAATKVQSHYLQYPDWAALVNRGTTDLEIALGEPAFQENNLDQVNPERVNLFVWELRRQQDQHPVHSLSDARTAVWNASQMAQLHLGLRGAATMMEYTAAMLGGLDEYSSFLSGGQLNDLYSQIEGNFVGLGVDVTAADGALLIVNVIHNSPAERGGIKPGDKIVNVGGQATSDVSSEKASELLQGPEGSTVQLAVVTGDNTPRQLTIRREHVDVPSVDDVKIVDGKFGVGYLKLSCFQITTNDDVDQALWQLHRDGMQSLIIDLRGNPGGLLTAAVAVAQKFIDSGTIVSTRGRNPGYDHNYQAHGTGQWRIPLVVLIDGDSASAAEILAGALRDYHRATIVGARSYGKGSVQGIFPLANGHAGVRLTTAKFYSPLGIAFSHNGIDPDVNVQVAAKPIDGHITLPISTGTPDDSFLNAALQVARQQVLQR